LVLLANDSEYSKSAGSKPILSPGCIYLVAVPKKNSKAAALEGGVQHKPLLG
jgi:hypothetical protein